MRKLTYKQAATCGENLKVRVTPEQSEKMQFAWFAAGKEWADMTREIKHIEEPYLFIHNDGDMTYYNNNKNVALEIEPDGCHDYHFSYKEIELIDDLPQPDFVNQQDVWAWLSQGNKIKNVIDNEVFGFKNNQMWNFTTGIEDNYFFNNAVEWKKHTPSRLIRVNGIEVPAPLESLDGLDSAWFVDITSKEKAFKIDVAESKCSANLNRWIKLGLLYATKEDAIKRADAMVKFEVVE